MNNLNSVIHQPVRLNIMTLLHMDKSMTFSSLKKELNLSDGNLGAHLDKLEKVGYVRIDKGFVERKPRSTICIEKLGENELLKYMGTIEKIFKWVKS